MIIIGFIGAGNMASAIMGGIVRSGMEALLLACDPDGDKLAALRGSCGLRPCPSIAALLAEADYVFLAVKPQSFPEVLSEARGHLRPETVVVSIAAGVTSAAIRQALACGPEGVKIVRAMPNTPLLLGCGATALSRAEGVSDGEFAFVRQIFDSAGTTAVIPEEKMNEIIPINGSSPAFIYLFARYFIDYGKSQGLDESVCLSLFAQTLIGSARMLTDSGRGVGELIEMVSSKGGTTIAGLEGLRENGLEAAVKAACEQCVRRAYELTS